MAILSKGITFAEDDNVTAATLNSHVDSATFDDPADESTIELNTGTGKLQLKDGGIAAAKIADDTITNAKMAASAVSGGGGSGDNCVEAQSITTTELAPDCITESEINDSAVESEHLNNNVISGQTELAAAPADTDEFLISDGGTLKRIDLADLAKARFFPQCFGVVTHDDSAPAVAGDYNVASVSEPSEGVRRVTFSNAMADTDYVVLVTWQSSALTAEFAITAKATTYFDITPSRADGTGYLINFAVFGTRA